MPITKQSTLTAIYIHFATQDIVGEDGAVLMRKGAMKSATVEYVDTLEEDGAVLSTLGRRTAQVADLESLPEIKSELVAGLARATVERNDALRRFESSEAARAVLERERPTTRVQ